MTHEITHKEIMARFREETEERFRLIRTHLETLEVELHSLAGVVDRWIQQQAPPVVKAEEPLDSIGE